MGVGAEATGVVVDAGPGVALRPEHSCLDVPARRRSGENGSPCRRDDLVLVPDSLTDDVAAQMLINPITVLMLRRAAQQHPSVGFDGVILNNAAASSVGRLFTAGAAHHRIATISIVRSAARAEELAQRFPDVPVVSTAIAGLAASGCATPPAGARSRWRWIPSVATPPQTCCRCWIRAGR